MDFENRIKEKQNQIALKKQDKLLSTFAAYIEKPLEDSLAKFYGIYNSIVTYQKDTNGEIKSLSKAVRELVSMQTATSKEIKSLSDKILSLEKIVKNEAKQ